MSKRKQQCRSIAGFGAVALTWVIMGSPTLAAAQPRSLQASKPPEGGPRANWTGVWVLVGTGLDTQDERGVANPTGRPEDASFAGLALKGAKLKHEAVARAKVYTDAQAQGRPLGDRQCKPEGMPGFWGGPFAWEFIQSPDQINLFQEVASQTRRIYLDGRKHPSLDDVDPLFEGHSIGHWEGDVLVVDTVNISPQIDVVAGGISHGGGASHTEKSHILERFRPVGDDRIDVEVTVTNPDVLQEPWTFVRHLKRKPDLEIQDYDCQENNRNPVGPDGRERAILQQPQK